MTDKLKSASQAHDIGVCTRCYCVLWTETVEVKVTEAAVWTSPCYNNRVLQTGRVVTGCDTLMECRKAWIIKLSSNADPHVAVWTSQETEVEIHQEWSIKDNISLSLLFLWGSQSNSYADVLLCLMLNAVCVCTVFTWEYLHLLSNPGYSSLLHNSTPPGQCVLYWSPCCCWTAAGICWCYSLTSTGETRSQSTDPLTTTVHLCWMYVCSL